AAAAVWFPYHVERAERVIPLALETYSVLLKIALFPESGVSIIETRQYLRTGEIEIPEWAFPLGASVIPSEVEGSLESFKSGFSLRVPLMDTTIYLDYLAERFLNAGGKINANVHFKNLEDVDSKFDLVINCAGIGTRELLHDADLEPHRGQVAIVPKIEGLSCAIVCDD